MKHASPVRLAAAVLSLSAIVLITGCGAKPYKTSETLFAGRPVPPSKLTQRVLVATSLASLLSGSLEILDAKRDIRYSVYNTNSTFTISGYSSNAQQLINYPEQLHGYVFSSDGSLQGIDYSKESSMGSVSSSVAGQSSSITLPPDVQAVYSAEEQSGILLMAAPASGLATTASIGADYRFSIPGVYRVAVNPSHTVVLVFVRNSNIIYRLLKLNSDQVAPPKYLDCEPVNKPIYCVVPVGSTQADGSVRDPALHRPVNAYFSPDGSQAYILSCGRECGGSAATGDDVPGISFANLDGLRIDNYPTSGTYVTPIVSTTAVPGGVTIAISDGTTVYAAGQALQASGRYAGNLSLIPLSTKTVSSTFSISDGEHTKMLFADDNTLWIGASNCASGERARLNQNYNCLTRYSITNSAAAVVPAVTPGTAAVVPFPNSNLDQYYYGSLTGLCWVESLNKVYTAYGGQVHAFNTADGSEIDNSSITVQGTAMDVAYIDASTNDAN